MNPLNPDIRTFFESQPFERTQAVLQKTEQPRGELLRYVLFTIFEILVHTRSRTLNILPKPSENGVVTDYRTLVREDIRSMLEGFSSMRYLGGDLCEGIEFLFPRPSRLPVGVFFQKCSLDPMINGEPGVEELWMQGGHVLLMPVTGASVASTKKAPLDGERWAYMSIPRNEEARVSLQGGQECSAFTISRISQL